LIKDGNKVLLACVHKVSLLNIIERLKESEMVEMVKGWMDWTGLVDILVSLNNWTFSGSYRKEHFGL
jgi:hypothetical protein